MLPTIHAAAEDIRHRRFTPVDLLDQCLERLDRLEPQVRAWVHVDREGARATAAVLNAELRQGRWRGPLHGIPLGIKDIFDVFDWPTAAGSKLWAKSYARRDCTIVERLRQAGAVILGKTVTTAFASFDPPVTRNPWHHGRTPGGSSSGSAAAVACGMCLGAVGSQTGGSITRPAAYCGVAGFKPTYQRVSLDGVMPLAPSMDHPGPMARCVQDLAILLQAMAGADPRDPACSRNPVPNWLTALDEGTPPRLGRLRGLFEEKAEPATHLFLEAAIQTLRSQGATVTEVALPAAFAEVTARHRTVMAVEAAAYHGARLTRHPEDYPPRIRALLEEGLTCPAPDYAMCKRHQHELSDAMRTCLDGVDALLTPATPGPAPDAATTGDPAFNSPWSYTGLPTICLPAGWSAEGLPLAIQLIGGPWEEAKVLQAAAWCERVLNAEQRQPA